MTISNLGLYGPESVTWRLHADPVLAVAGLRALFLQALHPVAMAAVASHSAFHEDPWGRLRRTAEYIGITTYGTTEQAGRAAARVRGLHRRLSAIDPQTGEERRVDHPDLLLWVHCCEVDSFLTTLRRSGIRVTARDADRYVAEQVRGARLVGIDPGTVDVPHDVTGLAAYFDELRPRLHATPPTYEAARFLLTPPMRWWLRLATPAVPSWAAMASLAFCLLPGWARKMYVKLPQVPVTDIGATMSLRALRTALLALPASLREGPHYRAGKARVASVPIRRLEGYGEHAEPWGYHDVGRTAPRPVPIVAPAVNDG
jgi:uncharacterized protein (DUF2236 family)